MLTQQLDNLNGRVSVDLDEVRDLRQDVCLLRSVCERAVNYGDFKANLIFADDDGLDAEESQVDLRIGPQPSSPLATTTVRDDYPTGVFACGPLCQAKADRYLLEQFQHFKHRMIDYAMYLNPDALYDLARIVEDARKRAVDHTVSLSARADQPYVDPTDTLNLELADVEHNLDGVPDDGASISTMIRYEDDQRMPVVIPLPYVGPRSQSPAQSEIACDRWTVLTKGSRVHAD